MRILTHDACSRFTARISDSALPRPDLRGKRVLPLRGYRDPTSLELRQPLSRSTPPRGCGLLSIPDVGLRTLCRFARTSVTSGTVPGVELGYARVSTAKQDLDRQIEALAEAGIDRERIYVDKKSGATVERPGLRAVLEYAREGDVIVVHTLDRLGRTVRDTLNLIHELAERKVGGPQPR